MRAVGIHVFAGGFTIGMKRAGLDVDTHLETHGFALDTARAVAGVENIINCDAKDWPRVEAQVAYGNPRCTAFSAITCGHDATSHGAWAKQTCDIHELCDYAAGHYDFVVWESVTQAFTNTGRELVDYLVRDVFAPKHYRVAHVLVNAASFGNTQQRKRYFFVAYRDCFKFNVQPPAINEKRKVLWDAIGHLVDRPTNMMSKQASPDYDFDSYIPLSEDEWHVLPHIPNGWCLNHMGRYGYHKMSERFKEIWDLRNSDMPFSMHGLHRLPWLCPSPTMFSAAERWVHPDHDRPLTVGELTTIMGWPDIPRGPRPVPQLAKGVCPCVGEWLGQQLELSASSHWGDDDYESRYDDVKCQWVGRDTSGELEKTFDLRNYCGKIFEREDYAFLTNDRLHRRDMALRASRPT